MRASAFVRLGNEETSADPPKPLVTSRAEAGGPKHKRSTSPQLKKPSEWSVTATAQGMVRLSLP